jgi:hypothetical protein
MSLLLLNVRDGCTKHVWPARSRFLFLRRLREPRVQRTETLTLRLTADAPFVSVVGLKDGDARDPTIDDVNQPSQHEGDLGGYSAVTGPLGSSDAQATGDTTIHLYYQCQTRAGGLCPGSPFPAGDDPTNLQWHNANTPANP